jgi:hypothetical protein
MKNTTAMLEAIQRNFIKDLDNMSKEELIAELTHYIEQSITKMDSDEIRSTYQYMAETGEL